MHRAGNTPKLPYPKIQTILLVEKNINPLIMNQRHRVNQIILKKGDNHFHG